MSISEHALADRTQLLFPVRAPRNYWLYLFTILRLHLTLAMTLAMTLADPQTPDGQIASFPCYVTTGEVS